MSNDQKPTVDALVESLIGDLSGEKGEFTLDARQARSRLRQSLLSDPHRYALLLVQAAVLRNATEVHISADPRGFKMRFDGDPFTREDLEVMYDAAFNRAVANRRPGLAELALGSSGSMVLQPRHTRITSTDGKTAVRLTLRPDREDELDDAKPPSKEPATAVSVRYAKPQKPDADARQIVKYCAYADVPIKLNGKHVTCGMTLEDGLAPFSVKQEGIKTAVAFFPETGNPPSLRLVRNGVWMAEEKLETPGRKAAGFVALVDSDRIALDLSQAEMVENDALQSAREIVLTALTDCIVEAERDNPGYDFRSQARDRVQDMAHNRVTALSERHTSQQIFYGVAFAFAVLAVLVGAGTVLFLHSVTFETASRDLLIRIAAIGMFALPLTLIGLILLTGRTLFKPPLVRLAEKLLPDKARFAGRRST